LRRKLMAEALPARTTISRLARMEVCAGAMRVSRRRGWPSAMTEIQEVSAARISRVNVGGAAAMGARAADLAMGGLSPGRSLLGEALVGRSFLGRSFLDRSWLSGPWLSRAWSESREVAEGWLEDEVRDGAGGEGFSGVDGARVGALLGLGVVATTRVPVGSAWPTASEVEGPEG